jgi:hypothetical protein
MRRTSLHRKTSMPWVRSETTVPAFQQSTMQPLQATSNINNFLFHCISPLLVPKHLSLELHLQIVIISPFLVAERVTAYEALSIMPVGPCLIAQVVSHQPPTMKAQVRTWVSPCGFCGKQSGTRTGSSSIYSVFACQYHFTKALYSYIALGMNNRPVGDRSSEI